MEFLDYIDRFDKRETGEDESAMFPTTRKEAVDMIADTSDDLQIGTERSGAILRKTQAIFSAGSGE